MFSYDSRFELRRAVGYHARYRDNPVFLNAVKNSLRADLAGSLLLGSVLVDQGQLACLPEASSRAGREIRHPEHNGDDVLSAIMLLLEHGTAAHRRQVADAARALRSVYPDYAAFLELKRSRKN